MSAKRPPTKKISTDPSKLSVLQLQDLLRKNGLKVTGNKAELIDRWNFFQQTGVVTKQAKGKAKAKGKVDKPVVKRKMKPDDYLDKITDLKVDLIKDQKKEPRQKTVKIVQLKDELKALGLPRTGNQDELNQRLYQYLEQISPDQISRLKPIKVSEDDPKLDAKFDQQAFKTTEQVIQMVQPEDTITFLSDKDDSYYVYVVKAVDRTEGGLVEKIELSEKGYSFKRINDRWVRAYQAQAGKPSYVDGKLALAMEIN